MKTFALLALFVSLPALADSTPGQVNFAVDCMIHDASGKMLADLGSVGTEMDGSYKDSGTFTYGDLTVKANLVPSSHDAPEVTGPVLKVCFQKDGKVVAQAQATATADLDLALWEPSEDLFLHCEKMGMAR